MSYYFKNYLQRIKGDIEHFFFYLDVNEFYNMFGELKHDGKQTMPGEIEDTEMMEREKVLSREFFLTQASKIYDKYIRKGALQQVIDDTDMAKAIVCKLSNWNGEGQYPYDVFNLPSDMSLTYLTETYLDGFIDSEEYKEYKIEVEKEKLHRESHNDFQLLTNIPTNSVHTITEILINQTLCQMFESSIQNIYNKNLIHFYKEVQEYKAIPLTRKDYIMGRARKIYTKYIQRGSKQELNIKETIKKTISFFLYLLYLIIYVRCKIGLASECKPTLFDSMCNGIIKIFIEVIQVLENEEYFSFLQNPNYLKFLENNKDLEETYVYN